MITMQSCPESSKTQAELCGISYSKLLESYESMKYCKYILYKE